MNDDVYLNRENDNMKFMVEVEFEGIEREWWELKNRVLGLRELNGVKEVKLVESEKL